jgi:hypothetical protein
MITLLAMNEIKGYDFDFFFNGRGVNAFLSFVE